jgi:hypothetical protein
MRINARAPLYNTIEQRRDLNQNSNARTNQETLKERVLKDPAAT